MEGKRHFIFTECDKICGEKALELLKDYKNKNKGKLGGGAKKATDADTATPEGENSTLLNAMFANCVSRNICADIGSEINLMSPDVLSMLVEKGAKLSVLLFRAPSKYGLAISKDQDG